MNRHGVDPDAAGHMSLTFNPQNKAEDAGAMGV